MMARLARGLFVSADVNDVSDRVAASVYQLSGAMLAVLLDTSQPHATLTSREGTGWSDELLVALTADVATMWSDDSQRLSVAHDVHTAPAWSATAACLTALSPVRSALALRLTTPSRFDGVLIVFDERVGYFDSELGALLAVFAEHAALALTAAAEHTRAESLEVASEANRNICTAVGILMERFNIDEPAAYDELRHRSQTTGRPIRRLAEEMTLSEAVPVNHSPVPRPPRGSRDSRSGWSAPRGQVEWSSTTRLPGDLRNLPT